MYVHTFTSSLDPVYDKAHSTPYNLIRISARTQSHVATTPTYTIVTTHSHVTITPPHVVYNYLHTMYMQQVYTLSP